MSNAVLAFAKLEFHPGDAVLEGLAAEALRKIRTFSPQVGGVVWGIVGWGGVPAWHAVLRRIPPSHH